MPEAAPSCKSRKKIIWAALIGLLILLAVALLYFGRQHKIVLDNRLVVVEEQKYEPLPAALAGVNQETLEKPSDKGAATLEHPLFKLKFQPFPPLDASLKKAVELDDKGRAVLKVLGPSFNLKVQALDAPGGNAVGEVKNIDVTVGFARDRIVSLPMVMAGAEEYLRPWPDMSGESAGGATGFGAGRRPGAIDDDDEGEPKKYKRPGAIDLDEEEETAPAAGEEQPKKFKRPGAIDLDEMEETTTP